MPKSIVVYNKDQEVVGVFSNSNAAQSPEAKLNMLTDPTVSIALNGESTFTFTMTRKAAKWEDVNHPENKWHVDGRVYTLLSPDSVVYDGETISVTMHEDYYLLEKQYVGAHNVDPDIEHPDVHTVIILPKSPTSNRLVINGISYDDSSVVDSRGVLQPRGSAGYALWALIKANRFGWTLGVCDVIVDGFDAENDYGTFNLESDQEGILTNIKHVQELWGGVLIWDSLNKVVHLRDETKENSDFNTWKGFIADDTKNMTAKPRLIIDNDIITRAYVLGNGDIHIKEVNDGKLYIDNFSFSSTIYEGYITNPNIHYTGTSLSGPQQLKQWGERELAKLCRPRSAYSFSILDRSVEKDYAHDTFDIGDVIKVIFYNDVTGIREEINQRIIDLKRDPLGDPDCSLVVSDTVLNKRDIFALDYTQDSTPESDWNGSWNANDIYMDLDTYLSELFETGERDTLVNVFKQNIDLVTRYEETSAAAISLLSSKLEAHIQIYTSFVKETEQDFTDTYAVIDLVSYRLESRITLEATYQKEYTDGKFNIASASINALANEFESQISLEAAYSDNTIGSAVRALLTLTSGPLGSEIKILGDRVIVDNLYPYRIRSIADENDYLTIGSSGQFADLTWYSSGQPLFQIYDTGTGFTLKSYSNSLFTSSAIGIYFDSDVDFSGVNVTGIQARFG